MLTAAGTTLSLDFLCLQAGERRTAVLSSLVKYLGPEAASCIHYEEKVSPSVVKVFAVWYKPNVFALKSNTGA